jgi:hypothetical protein
MKLRADVDRRSIGMHHVNCAAVPARRDFVAVMSALRHQNGQTAGSMRSPVLSRE